jgi:cardiolipin synthase
VPNAVTVARLLVLVAFLVVLFGRNERVTATVLLAVAGATDFLDGFLARRLGQVSTLGKVIDPIADRVVLATAAVSIVVYGAVPVWLGVVVLAREAAVSIAAMVLAGLGARRIDVVRVGKAGTFGMMAALPLFLLADGRGAVALGLRVAAWVCVVPAEVLLLVATGIYLAGAGAALRDGRARPAVAIGTENGAGGNGFGAAPRTERSFGGETEPGLGEKTRGTWR